MRKLITLLALLLAFSFSLVAQEAEQDNITENPEVEVVQIQFNYMDVNEQAGMKGYKLTEELGIPLVIMEPIKGGTLASLPKDVDSMLIKGEEAIAAYKTLRDSAIFTNKRIIIRDAQGITGKKVEAYSIPYNSINMWSTENAGMIDFNSEVELWTRAGHLKINLNRGIDIRKFDKLIAENIL